jgi:hypothetical protein
MWMTFLMYPRKLRIDTYDVEIRAWNRFFLNDLNRKVIDSKAKTRKNQFDLAIGEAKAGRSRYYN